MSSLLGALVDEALERARALGDPRVERIVVGLYFTLALLDDGVAGLAYTNPLPPAGGGLEGLPGKPASRIVGLLASGGGVEISVGLAVANALLNRPGQTRVSGNGDPVEKLATSMPGGRAVMVGFFPGYVDLLSSRGWRVDVLELEAHRHPRGRWVRVRPWLEAGRLMEGADLLVVTGAVLANGSIDLLEPLLERVRGPRVMVGPSTPASMSLLEAFHALGYSVVRDSGTCGRMVALAAGARELFSRACLEKRVFWRRGGTGESKTL